MGLWRYFETPQVPEEIPADEISFRWVFYGSDYYPEELHASNQQTNSTSETIVDENGNTIVNNNYYGDYYEDDNSDFRVCRESIAFIETIGVGVIMTHGTLTCTGIHMIHFSGARAFMLVLGLVWAGTMDGVGTDGTTGAGAEALAGIIGAGTQASAGTTAGEAVGIMDGAGITVGLGKMDTMSGIGMDSTMVSLMVGIIIHSTITVVSTMDQEVVRCKEVQPR